MEKGNAMAITVFLADGHSVFMKGIAENLRRDKRLCATMAGEQSLSLLDYILKNHPDFFIYIIDKDEERKGFPTLREIRKACDDRVWIIAISEIEKIETARRFLYLGGSGYLLRSTAEEEIYHAIWSVSHDCLFVCSRLQDSFLKKSLIVSPPQDPGFFACLSEREWEVLSWLQKGKTIQEIGDLISLSSGHVDNIKKSIMGKLEIHDKTDLRIKILFADLD
jgi:two-component system, NarL family, response regulator NreC